MDIAKEVRYDNGLVKLVSQDIHSGLSSVLPLITAAERFSYDCSGKDSREYRGIDVGVITPRNADLGAYPALKLPLNHGSDNVLNLIRTFPSSPDSKPDLRAILGDRPKEYSGLDYFNDNLFISGIKKYYVCNTVDSGNGSMIELCELSYVSSKHGSGKKHSFARLLEELKSADMIFAYAPDDAKVNHIFEQSGMKPVQGNVGKNLDDRLFVWYISN